MRAAVRVLDSYSLIAYLEGETGSDDMVEIFKLARDSGRGLYLSVVNWGEVYYITLREAGRLRDGNDGVSPGMALDSDQAGFLKVKQRPVGGMSADSEIPCNGLAEPDPGRSVQPREKSEDDGHVKSFSGQAGSRSQPAKRYRTLKEFDGHSPSHTCIYLFLHRDELIFRKPDPVRVDSGTHICPL